MKKHEDDAAGCVVHLTVQGPIEQSICQFLRDTAAQAEGGDAVLRREDVELGLVAGAPSMGKWGASMPVRLQRDVPSVESIDTSSSRHRRDAEDTEVYRGTVCLHGHEAAAFAATHASVSEMECRLVLLRRQLCPALSQLVSCDDDRAGTPPHVDFPKIAGAPSVSMGEVIVAVENRHRLPCRAQLTRDATSLSVQAVLDLSRCPVHTHTHRRQHDHHAHNTHTNNNHHDHNNKNIKDDDAGVHTTPLKNGFVYTVHSPQWTATAQQFLFLHMPLGGPVPRVSPYTARLGDEVGSPSTHDAALMHSNALVSLTLYVNDPRTAYRRDRWLRQLPPEVSAAVDRLDGADASVPHMGIDAVTLYSASVHSNTDSECDQSDPHTRWWCVRPLRAMPPVTGAGLDAARTQHCWSVVVRYAAMVEDAVLVEVRVPCMRRCVWFPRRYRTRLIHTPMIRMTRTQRGRV